MSVFSSVRGNSVGRSVFNLSHVKRFTCDMGELIPALFLECVPGDTFKIGADVVTRFQPLVAPILDSVDLTVHYFFVPTRLLMDNEKDWETFLTGGKDGTDESVTLPRWDFSFFDGFPGSGQTPFSNRKNYGKYSLWDYFGLPTEEAYNFDFYNNIKSANHILGFAQRAYNLVFNEFYRDENLVDEVVKGNGTILYRSWKKDYFTSALPWQQRGVSPALPISGSVPVNFGDVYFTSPITFSTAGGERGSLNSFYANSSVDGGNNLAIGLYHTSDTTKRGLVSDFGGKATSSNTTVDLSNATTFDVAV